MPLAMIVATIYSNNKNRRVPLQFLSQTQGCSYKLIIFLGSAVKKKDKIISVIVYILPLSTELHCTTFMHQLYNIILYMSILRNFSFMHIYKLSCLFV